MVFLHDVKSFKNMKLHITLNLLACSVVDPDLEQREQEGSLVLLALPAFLPSFFNQTK